MKKPSFKIPAKLSEMPAKLKKIINKFSSKKPDMNKINELTRRLCKNPAVNAVTRMKIGTRLNVIFLTIMIITILAMGISLMFLRDMSRQNEQFYNEAYQVVDLSNKLQYDFQKLQTDLFLAAFEIDMEEGIQQRFAVVEADQEALIADAEAARKLYKGDAADFERFDELVIAMEEPKQYFIDAIKVGLGRNQKMFTAYQENYEPLLKESAELLTKISNNANDTAIAMNRSMQSLLGAAVIISIILMILVAAVVFLASRLLTLTIVPPIQEIEGCASELSRGNLSGVEIAYTGSDELGQLADSMRSTANSLNAYISDISRCLEEISKGNLNIEPSADFAGEFVAIDTSLTTIISSLNSTFANMGKGANQVSSSSQNVAADAESLAQGSVEQSSSIDALIGSIDSISVQIQNNAKSAKEADDIAELLVTDVEKGNRCMTSLTGAMTEISERSEQIGNIINTIEDIAFQTNILALNAAVEAARAGDAGKGFAVVADEVRNLANKSAEAANDTNALIEKTLESIKIGMGIAKDTADALTAVVNKVDNVASAIKSISNVCEEQEEEINSVTKGINQISVVVQKNSQAAENSAATSKTLSEQSNLLSNLVHEFKLKQ